MRRGLNPLGLVALAIALLGIGSALAWPIRDHYPPFGVSTPWWSCAPAALKVGGCTTTGTPANVGGALKTCVTKFNAAALAQPGTGSLVRLRLYAPLSGSLTFSQVYIGASQTGTGTCGIGTGFCPQNFNAAPTQLLSAGSGTITLAGNSVQSYGNTDYATFAWPANQALSIAFNEAAGSTETSVTPASTAMAPNSTGNINTFCKAAATLTAKIDNGSGSAGTTLTVTATGGSVTNAIVVGSLVVGSGVAANTVVTAKGTGTGGTGTYTVSVSQLVTSESMSVVEAGATLKSTGYTTTAGKVNSIQAIFTQ